MTDFSEIFNRLSDAKLVAVLNVLSGLLRTRSDSVYYVAWSVAWAAVQHELKKRGISRDHGVSGTPSLEGSHNGSEVE